MRFTNLVSNFLAFFILLASVAQPLHAYTDGGGSDYVIDAPWRTIRDNVPVLFFIPDLKSGQISKFELWMHDKRTNSTEELLFSDVANGADKTTCEGAGRTHPIEIIDDVGRIRGTLQSGEVSSHWHYIVRIPTICLGLRGLVGLPGLKFIEGKISTTDGVEISKVLRIVVQPDAKLPKFHPSDQHFDSHFHTIAEQTAGEILDIDSGFKAFGGPLAMMIESAYALGMVGDNLDDGNWREFKNLFMTTDHSAFFSTPEFDLGGSPKFGPTKDRDSNHEEFEWYRSVFGDLSGEEVTLRGTGRTIASGVPSFGSHFLVYGAPHYDGPWHGGGLRVSEIVPPYLKPYSHLPGLDFLSIAFIEALEAIPSGKSNPWPIREALQHAGSGFGYAAHPFSDMIGWSSSNFDSALGYSMFGNTRSDGFQIDATGKDFVFKGSQVWNGKNDFRVPGRVSTVSLKSLNPFMSFGPVRFIGNENWDDAVDGKPRLDANGNPVQADDVINGPFGEYLAQLARGLKFSFSDQPNLRFARKIYMTAGTDAHGDFNYSASLPATIIPETTASISVGGTTINDAIEEVGFPIVSLDSNAFGRVRTYTLSGDSKIAPGSNIVQRQVATVPEPPLTDGGHGPGIPIDHGSNPFREGNTVLTDGPICIFHVDNNCRFDSDPDPDNTSWHDGNCKFENADGSIGGSGNFDGARTALVPRDSGEIWIQSKWMGRNDYIYSINDQSNMNMTLISQGPGFRRKTSIVPGIEGKNLSFQLENFPLSNRRYDPSALLLRGQRGSGVGMSMCMTNPIWTVPYTIRIDQPLKCPIQPNELKVTVKFGASMDPKISERCTNNCLAGESRPYHGAQISVNSLNDSGISFGRPIFLTRDDKWHDLNFVTGGGKIGNASLSAHNSETIPCSGQNWDAVSHETRSFTNSYAVVISEIHDTNLNRLGDIGKAFSVLTRNPVIHENELEPLPGNDTLFVAPDPN